ncbi:MAG: cation:proton antiporter [Elusimicrobia bacterium]|nr:cation:proton antiporter [Elusimicrobiota bacterium]
MHQAPLPLLTDIGLGIIFAAAAGNLLRLLGQPLILGYVLGGILLGPQLGLGLVNDPASIELISEIGLILLLFIIGLEINLRELSSMGRAVFFLGTIQFLSCLALGLGYFSSLGSWMAPCLYDRLYLALALALSSTLIVVKLLHDKFEVATTPGRLTIGVLVLQDLWAILFMAFQPNLLHPELASVLKSLGQGAVLVALAFGASRHLLGRILHAAGKAPELVLLTSLAWCFSLCGLAQSAGLSKEMGALIAGMSIAAFPYGADVAAKLSGVRDFFVTLFFVSLGLKFPNPTGETLAAAGVAVGVVLATRLLTVAPAARLLGLGLRTGLVAALNLAQISEFSLVILALGAGYGHVSSGLPSLLLMAMLSASVLSTYIIMFNDPLARGIMALLGRFGIAEKTGPGSRPEEVKARDIVLLGCYREGEAFLRVVESDWPEAKERILVVDYNPALRSRLEKRGFLWVYGDLAHPETLEHLKIEQARLVICSLSDTFLKGTSNRRLLGHLKRLAPEARLILTAEETAEAEHLLAAGAQEVILPNKLAGGRLFELMRRSLAG